MTRPLTCVLRSRHSHIRMQHGVAGCQNLGGAEPSYESRITNDESHKKAGQCPAFFYSAAALLSSFKRAFRWLLCRAALLRWMIPLLTIESMIGAAAFRFAAASSLLPASTAFVTLLIAVRSLERNAMLWARRLTV